MQRPNPKRQRPYDTCPIFEDLAFPDAVAALFAPVNWPRSKFGCGRGTDPGLAIQSTGVQRAGHALVLPLASFWGWLQLAG